MQYSLVVCSQHVLLHWLQVSEGHMRTHLFRLTLIFCLASAGIGCSSKPPADNTAGSDAQNAPGQNATANGGTPDGREVRERKEARERKREPIVVAAGTSITVRLG